MLLNSQNSSAKKTPWQRLPENIQWGLIWGASAAAFFSIIAVGIQVFALLLLGDDPLAAIAEIQGVRATNIWEVLLSYWAAGLTAGAICGWLRPLGARSYWGSALVGLVAAVPVSTAFMLVIVELSNVNRTAIIAWVLFVLLGPFYALAFRYRYGGELKKDASGEWWFDR